MLSSCFKRWRRKIILRVKFLYIGIAFALIGLTLILSSFATPTSDDYCIAFAGKNYGILNSFNFLNKNWTPSTLYLPMLYFWSLGGNGSFLASIICLLTTLSFILVTFFLSSKISKSLSIPTTFFHSLLILPTGLILSIIISQSSILWTAQSAKSGEPVGIVKEWVSNFIFEKRDGQLAQWIFSTPLTSTKVVLNLVLIALVASNVSLLNQSKSRLLILLIPFTLIILTFGLSTEPLVALLFICYICLQAIRINGFSPAFLSPIAIIFIGIGTLYKLPGSMKRESVLADRDLSELFKVFLGVAWQTIFLLLATCIAALIVHIYLRLDLKNLDIPKHNALLRSFFVLLACNIVVNSVIETFAYPSAYHWIGIIFSSYLFFFLFFMTRLRSIYINPYSAGIGILVGVYAIFSLNLTVNTEETRLALWNARAEKRILSPTEQVASVPRVDNLGHQFMNDINSEDLSIVPGMGYISNASGYCYSKLPKSW